MDDNRLKKYFHFNDADLSANRNGRLSENQRKRLDDAARAERKSARESAGILFGIGAAGLAFGLTIVLNAPVLAGKILIGLTLCVLWPLAWGWRGWTAWRSAPSEKAGQPRWARGRVHVTRHEDANGSVDHVLEVDGRQFDVDKDPSGVIAEGDECVVYYLEETEEILSVEVL